MGKIEKAFKRLIKRVVDQLAAPMNTLYIKKEVRDNREVLLQRNMLKETLEGERVLILAPHVDDDFIGCGGAISQYIQGGKAVFIAYLTDSGKRGSKKGQDAIAQQRKKEAVTAANTIGIPLKRLFFLGGEDGNLKNSEILKGLEQVIEETNADTIFAPVFLDTHRDHIHTGLKLMALKEGLEKKGKQSVLKNKTLYFYEAQSPMTQFYSNITLDITPCWHKKERVLECYPSQKTPFHFVKENNRLNGILYNKPYCEVFLKTTLERFYEKISPEKNQLEKLSAPLIAHSGPRNYKRSYQSSKINKKLLDKL